MALRARMPAPTMTAGLEVFVQLVIAAISTAPSVRSNVSGPRVTPVATASPRSFVASVINPETLVAALRNGMRS